MANTLCDNACEIPKVKGPSCVEIGKREKPITIIPEERHMDILEEVPKRKGYPKEPRYFVSDNRRKGQKWKFEQDVKDKRNLQEYILFQDQYNDSQ